MARRSVAGRIIITKFGEEEGSMTGSELIAEAERLARPCVLLRDKGTPDRLAAVWGGPGLVAAPEGSFRHWLTFDCRFLPDGVGPPTGCLSVYTDEEQGESGAAVLDREGQLIAKRGNTKLYAREARSLPPLDAVFRFGSPAVHQWLRSWGWEPDWGYNSNFKDPEPALQYERLYQSECPLYAGGAYAVLGGWHFPWPDGDWEVLLERPLLIWTFAGSEPWVEVWGGRPFEVKQRIT
jgi:hypothetical protein